MIRENQREVGSGFMALALLIIIHVAVSVWMVTSIISENVFGIVLSAVIWSIIFFFWPGFFIVNPNEARVLQLFGKYVGTVKAPGLKWANPFYMKHKISLRVRNFETGKLKVNDANSNPIEIGCVVVWRVIDTAEAMFEVDDYVNYVHVQSEAAVRNLATDYPYDAHDHGDVALSSHTNQISEQLKGEVQARLEKAGVEVIEARISHLAYSPEIAHAMLQRQQASAVVAARTKIVEGAVGMVDLALDYLSKNEIIELDEERKAAMVSNLLTVLCSDRGTQPVVNTGTIYQ
jgi:regulator of protease activity HflC (stomatin/prohibitin superfamily)